MVTVRRCGFDAQAQSPRISSSELPTWGDAASRPATGANWEAAVGASPRQPGSAGFDTKAAEAAGSLCGWSGQVRDSADVRGPAAFKFNFKVLKLRGVAGRRQLKLGWLGGVSCGRLATEPQGTGEGIQGTLLGSTQRPLASLEPVLPQHRRLSPRPRASFSDRGCATTPGRPRLAPLWASIEAQRAD